MLADAGALLAASTAASAGITIPAGEWTVDIGGNVNAYYTNTKFSGNMDVAGVKTKNMVQTGLLPTALGIGAKTRQNDMDIAFQFSFWTGVNGFNGGDDLNAGSTSSNGGLGYNSLNIRQAYLTFGDASWGTIKAGRDLGLFGSDAILSDMTLLGVGSGAGGGGSSTLGRIGSGYLYADWVGQLQYTSPNWNGFQFAAAVREPAGNIDKNDMGYDAKATYSFSADDVTGKVWVGGINQKIQNGAVNSSTGVTTISDKATAHAWELGGKVAFGKAELVAYYYDGKNMDSGIGTFLSSASSGLIAERDNKGGYVQGTYVIPTGTKIGASWGRNIIEKAGSDLRDFEREAWIVGAYHPLTKSLNLVAEYNNLEQTSASAATNKDGKAKTISLGAILFF